MKARISLSALNNPLSGGLVLATFFRKGRRKEQSYDL
jgi:hypothetical protein